MPHLAADPRPRLRARSAALLALGLSACAAPRPAAPGPGAPAPGAGAPPAAPVARAPAASPPRPAAPGPCPAPPATFETIADVSYTGGPDARPAHRLDLYVPDGPGPYPLLVWIHGGAWRGGDKRSCPVSYQAARGYVVASVNYRLSGEARFPAQIQDVKAAIRFLRARAAAHKIDPARVAVSGDSAGGHLSALAATSGGVAAFEDAALGHAGVSSRVSAAIPFFGPSDLLAMNRQAEAAGCPAARMDHDAPGSPESQLVGCPIQSCPEKARAADPITYVTADDPPFLVQHGARDCTVPAAQSRVLHEALAAAGVPSTLVIEPDRAHGGAPFRRAVLDAFLDRHLGACAPAPARAGAPPRVPPQARNGGSVDGTPMSGG